MNTSSNEIWSKMEDASQFENRSYRFRDEMLPIIYQYLGITPQSKVLDAGCGSGVFTRYLAKGLIKGHITGFDISKSFINHGKGKIERMGLTDKVTLEYADGYNLFYEDNTFDAVTNYTYMGVLSDPTRGLEELIRVCKPGGTVSCFEAGNNLPHATWQGDYSFKGADELQRLSVLEENIFVNFARSAEEWKQTSEWHSMRRLLLMKKCGLANIHLYPYAHAICFNDSRYEAEFRREFVLKEIRDDINWRTWRYKGKEKIYTKHGLSEKDFTILITLLERKYEYMKNNFDKDTSFEWFGGFNFIITGQKR